jgi:hypothetical protein
MVFVAISRQLSCTEQECAVMQRILTKRRLMLVVATGAAAALLANAVGATRIVLPGAAAVAGGTAQWASRPAAQVAVPVPQAAGVLSSTLACVSPSSSRTVMTHSFDAVHHMWVVHVARALCSSLFVQEAAYRKPLQGGLNYPQHLSSVARLVRMQAPGTYHVPLVARNVCVQTDTGANWNSPPRWPPILSGPGVTQPQQLSHWSRGPNTWTSSLPAACKPFLPPPAPKVVANCPLDCTGIAQVTMSARNPVTFSGLLIAPIVNGRMLTTKILRLGPGRSGSVVFSARDGDVITFAFVYPNSTHPPFKPVGRPFKVLCPPGAPPLVVTLACPCAGDITGTIQVTNASRFALEVAVLVDGLQRVVIPVAPKQSGNTTLTTSRQATVTFGFRYNTSGHFPPTFTPVSFKVTMTA